MVLAVIQARLGSTRLPGKSLMAIDGKPLIQHVIDRVRRVQALDKVVVASPWLDVLAFEHAGITASTFWADVPDEDVLSRYYRAAQQYQATTIMRVTGDCPLWNPRVGAAVLGLYFSCPLADYASNVAEGYVDGEDTEVFSMSALTRAHLEATDPKDREHVTPWMRRHCKTVTLFPHTTDPKPKTSVDTMSDLMYVRSLCEPL